MVPQQLKTPKGVFFFGKHHPSHEETMKPSSQHHEDSPWKAAPCFVTWPLRQPRHTLFSRLTYSWLAFAFSLLGSGAPSIPLPYPAAKRVEKITWGEFRYGKNMGFCRKRGKWQKIHIQFTVVQIVKSPSSPHISGSLHKTHMLQPGCVNESSIKFYQSPSIHRRCPKPRVVPKPSGWFRKEDVNYWTLLTTYPSNHDTYTV